MLGKELRILFRRLNVVKDLVNLLQRTVEWPCAKEAG